MKTDTPWELNLIFQTQEKQDRNQFHLRLRISL